LHVNLLKRLRARRFLKLQGLDPEATYKNSLDGTTHTGDYYMNAGLNLSIYLNEFDSHLITLEKV